MSPQRFPFGGAALAALGLLAGVAGAVRAQPASGYTALSGYTSGSPLDRRPLLSPQSYPPTSYPPGSATSRYPPILMTTINTPGLYGAYTFGAVDLSLFNREPLFYPAYPTRAVIPAVTTTVAPLQAATPAAPASATLTAGPLTEIASIRVRLPAGAQLSFQGVDTAATGNDRRFVTPPLAVGRNYQYDVVANWTQEGRPVRESRQVLVRAGDRLDIDFLKPAPEAGTPTLRTRPLPPLPQRPKESSEPAPLTPSPEG
jgi:uncharacterized protein (TIGR03000 family)